MSIIRESEIRESTSIRIAEQMIVAARTAPKGRGIDDLDYCILYGDHLNVLANKMIEIGQREGMSFFERDANNVQQAEAVVLLGSRIASRGIKKCGFCGFENCAEKAKYPMVPCSFNAGDLGIAIGSAVSIAADNRIDNRVMFSVGFAAIELGIMQAEVKIAYGIPLYVGPKSIFYDRS